MKIQDVLDKITALQTQILRYGIQQLSSISHPTSPALGQVIYEADTGRLVVWTGAEWNPLSAGGVLSGGFKSVTANQTGITTAVDLTGLSATVTVGTNRRIKVTGFCGWQTNTAGDGFNLRINEGASVLNQSALVTQTINTDQVIFAQWIGNPSAGAHTYKLVGVSYVGGTAQMSASGVLPAFLLIEDLGPHE